MFLSLAFVLLSTVPGTADPALNDARLNDICFVDSRHGWAVGDRGVIWSTEDGGRQWRLQPSGVTCSLGAVCFCDEHLGWAAGGFSHPYTHTSSGVLLTTRDGGQTWGGNSNLMLPALRRLGFFDPQHGWAVGSAFGHVSLRRLCAPTTAAGAGGRCRAARVGWPPPCSIRAPVRWPAATDRWPSFIAARSRLIRSDQPSLQNLVQMRLRAAGPRVARRRRRAGADDRRSRLDVAGAAGRVAAGRSAVRFCCPGDPRTEVLGGRHARHPRVPHAPTPAAPGARSPPARPCPCGR